MSDDAPLLHLRAVAHPAPEAVPAALARRAAEGARAVAAASESESRVRTKLYGWAVNGTDVRPAQSPKTAL